MSTVQRIYNRAAALPEAQQREALDFIEFLAAKYSIELTLPKLTARDVLRLPPEERAQILAQQSEYIRQHYAANPDEILPDMIDALIEETS